MGSTPSKQSDDFPKHMDNPFPNNGAGANVSPMAASKKGFPTSKDEALVRKHQSRSPGSGVSWSTTSRTPESVQVDGACKDSDNLPDYPSQQRDAAIETGGHFKATH